MNRKQFCLSSIAILVALLVGAALNTVFHVQPAQAQTGRQRAIPKDWGTLKGSVGLSLIFEDSNGTIRVVNIDPRIAQDTWEFRRN